MAIGSTDPAAPSKRRRSGRKPPAHILVGPEIGVRVVAKVWCVEHRYARPSNHSCQCSDCSSRGCVPHRGPSKGSSASYPTITSIRRARSATLRAMGPIEACSEGQPSNIPVRLTRPAVGRMETTSLSSRSADRSSGLFTPKPQQTSLPKSRQPPEEPPTVRFWIEGFGPQRLHPAPLKSRTVRVAFQQKFTQRRLAQNDRACARFPMTKGVRASDESPLNKAEPRRVGIPGDTSILNNSPGQGVPCMDPANLLVCWTRRPACLPRPALELKVGDTVEVGPFYRTRRRKAVSAGARVDVKSAFPPSSAA